MQTADKLIVILGPTASGKSGLAVELAKKYNGEIISADSRQVYRGMNIGTGKVPISYERSKFTKSSIPSKNGIQMFYKGIRHHLIDVADPKQRFTVAQYKRLALKAINDIQKRGKLPIICGGTGFYIRAITDDLPIPKVKPDLKLRARLEKKSVGELFSELKRLDPARAATIDSKNPRRLIRALEIIYKTGKPVPELNAPHPPLKIRGGAPSLDSREGWSEFKSNTLFLGIQKSPAELKKLIHKRLLKRLKQGMIEEVKNLRKSGVSWKRLDSFGLEYRWIADYLQKIEILSLRGVPHLAGRRSNPAENNRPLSATGLPRSPAAAGSLAMTREKKRLYQEMLSRLQKDSEHYAKRQMVWFNKYPGKAELSSGKKIRWVSNKTQAERLVKKFVK